MKKRTPDSTYPRLGQALVVLVMLLVVQTIFFAMVAVVGGAFGLGVSQSALTIGVVNLLAFSAVVYWGWRRTGVSWRSVFPLVGFPVGLLLPIGLVVLGGSVVLSEIDNLFRTVLPVSASVVEFFESLGTEEAGLLVSSFVLVMVAPVTEEFLFRGLILRGLRRHHSARWAIVISALMFGLSHMNPWQFFPTFFGGLLLAWLTLETGTLWPAILTHAANNALSSWVPSFLPEIPGYSSGLSEEVTLQPLWFDFAGLSVLAVGLWLVLRMIRSAESPLADGRTTKRPVGSAPAPPASE